MEIISLSNGKAFLNLSQVVEAEWRGTQLYLMMGNGKESLLEGPAANLAVKLLAMAAKRTRDNAEGHSV